MKEILLTQGKIAVVDDDDFEYLRKHKWHYARRYTSEYAGTFLWTDKKNVLILMHRMVIGARKGEEVDHKDCNGLNNQKDNLRLVTHSQNMQNLKPRDGKYKGTSYRKDRGLFEAYIGTPPNKQRLGHYCSEIAAACAYDYAAIELFGEFAKMNFPEGQPMTMAEVKQARRRKKSECD